MPAQKKQLKLKTRLKLKPSRLIKTKGKFSKSKLATIIVSFAAIGALVISMTHAWSYQDIVTWQETLLRGYYLGWCSDSAQGCYMSANNIPSGQIVWWGPYHRLGVPSPTGMNDALCVNYAVSGAVNITFKAEVTANFGNSYLGGYYYTTPNDINGYNLHCGGVHIPPSLAGYWDAVEYRIRIIGYSGGGAPYLYIGQVGLFQ